jgi:hypothetical protein
VVNKKIKIASLVLLSSLFVACGGGGGGSSPNETPGDNDNTINISGKAIDGYLSGSTVTLKNGTTTIETNTTASDGSWHLKGIELAGDKPYLEISGGNDTATGEAFKGGMKLKQLVEEDITSYNVTPLTTLVTEVILNETGTTKASAKQTIATALGLTNSDLLDADPIALLNTDSTNAQKLIKNILVVQKYAESYDSIASNDKRNENGLLQIAKQLNNDQTLSNAIANVSNMITDTNAKATLNSLYSSLSEINETTITNTTTLNNVSRSIETATLTIEQNLASGSYQSALTNANSINLTQNIQDEEQNDNLTTSISNGYYETVLNYSANSDVNFSVNLPQGSYYIIAEPASNNLLTQIEIDSNITDGNGSSYTSGITSINLRTASSGTAKIKITNSSTDIQKYIIPVRAYQSTSQIAQSSNIWVGAMNVNSQEINTTKNFTLDLVDKTNNVGVVLSEHESTHNWSFNTNDFEENGNYTINVTTNYENNKNPLRYFSITLKEDSKTIGTKYTDEADASLDVQLEQNKNYILEVRIIGGEIPAAKADSLGYYQIELTQ